jgi:hypothetical protein
MNVFVENASKAGRRGQGAAEFKPTRHVGLLKALLKGI